MGSCVSMPKSERSDLPDKTGRAPQYAVPSVPNPGETDLQNSSNSSIQPTLTESAVQSVGGSPNPSEFSGITGGIVRSRRASSNANSTSLQMIHEERQESFHSANSRSSFVSAVSKFSEIGSEQQSYSYAQYQGQGQLVPVLEMRKKQTGRESPLEHHLEGGIPRDHIPNDELNSFWQPMSLSQNSGVADRVPNFETGTTHGFKVIGHKIIVQQKSGASQQIGSEDSLPDKPFDNSVQGTNVEETIVFRISEQVEELTCIKRITKGVMQFTLTEQMGDYDPGEYRYDFPGSVIPKGPFSRGQYHVTTTFVDVHGDELFSCVGDFKVIKHETQGGITNGTRDKP